MSKNKKITVLEALQAMSDDEFEVEEGLPTEDDFEDEEGEVLDEGLDDSYSKYYSDIKRPLFNKIIALDPTFNAEQDKLGTYGKWLLNAYKKENLKERDFPRVREILDDFDHRKRYLPTPQERDIGKYKTIDEVRSSLDNVQLSQGQIQKQAKKGRFYADLGTEAEFVAENGNWEIWKPLSYQASCKLGSGTSWCTARASNDYYYNSYKRSGELYIFLHKTRESNKKFQAHVDTKNHVTTFMDEHDRPSIPFATFLASEDLTSTLKRGETYIYTGGKIKPDFIPLIKKVRFSPDFTDDVIPGLAFKGCVELEQIVIPITIKKIGSRAFEGCDKVTIYTPKHPLVVWPADREFLLKRIKYIRE